MSEKSVTNLCASTFAWTKPSACSSISQMFAKSGTTIAHGRKSAFRFSGSSVRPAYPGFIVMKAPTVGISAISSSSNVKISFLPLIAPRTEPYWPATTDNTSTGMRLNSSKQPHAPVCASPEKMFAITL